MRAAEAASSVVASASPRPTLEAVGVDGWRPRHAVVVRARQEHIAVVARVQEPHRASLGVLHEVSVPDGGPVVPRAVAIHAHGGRPRLAAVGGPAEKEVDVAMVSHENTGLVMASRVPRRVEHGRVLKQQYRCRGRRVDRLEGKATRREGRRGPPRRRVVEEGRRRW